MVPRLLALLLGVLAVPDPAAAAVRLEPVLSGLEQPVYVAQPRDGSRRLFVVEQPGRIRVLVPDSGGPSVFLDLSDRVLSGGERGLLGLAFHPRCASNGRLFVNSSFGEDEAGEVYVVGLGGTVHRLADR